MDYKLALEKERQTGLGRDLDLGKVALYQLSYCRVNSFVGSIPLNASAKVATFFEPTNFLGVFFQKY